MSIKLTTAITLLALFSLGSANLLLNTQNAVDKRFREHFLKSSALIEANPQDYFECFGAYLPQINELTAIYETAYGLCLSNADDARAAVDAAMAPQRSKLESDAADTCTKFDSCSEDNKDALSFFQCFASAANEASRTARVIQNSADGAVQEINFKLVTVKYDEDLCTTTASDTYTKDSSKVYEEFNDCLSGTVRPTNAPTEEPTDAPTEEPTDAPTDAPTEEPTDAPTEEPTNAPTEEPTDAPTEEPTDAPTEEPTDAPTEEPTDAPTEEPTDAPTDAPTDSPTEEIDETLPEEDLDLLKHSNLNVAALRRRSLRQQN